MMNLSDNKKQSVSGFSIGIWRQRVCVLLLFPPETQDIQSRKARGINKERSREEEQDVAAVENRENEWVFESNILKVHIAFGKGICEEKKRPGQARKDK